MYHFKVIKEGWLYKQSRHLKRWKLRWTVLTEDARIYTFKQKQVYDAATEIIDLRIYSSVKSSEDLTNKEFSFNVYCHEDAFSFSTDKQSEKEDWIRAIGRQIVMSHTKSWQNDDIQ